MSIIKTQSKLSNRRKNTQTEQKKERLTNINTKKNKKDILE